VITYTGRSLRRFEDERLLRGQGSFVEDKQAPGVAHMAVVRSTEPHARVRGIDTDEARALPGVLAVYTAADLQAFAHLEVMRRPGVASKEGAEHPLLAEGLVCYVGQPVALVVAESPAIAEDAAGLVRPDYDPLPPLWDVRAALGAPPLHPAMGDNVCLHNVIGDGDPDAAIARAANVVRAAFWVPRVSPAPLECRGALAIPGDGVMEFFTSTQSPHEMRAQLRHVFGEGAPDFHVVGPDVGGGFGMKHHLYPDEAATAVAAHLLGRPVRWIERRGENLVASHARGYWGSAEAGFDAQGVLLGIRFEALADIGGYHIHGSFISPDLSSKRLIGPYRVAHMRVDLKAVMTNKPPMGPYRGAGQPEVTYMMERVMDRGAVALGMDPAQLRRVNMLGPDEFPHTTPGGLTYDTGNYAPVLERALERVDYAALRAEQARRREVGEGPLLGVGIATITAGSGGSGGQAARSSYARVTIAPDGRVLVDSDVFPHGQGMATTFAQLVADQLGVRPWDVTLRTGDTALSKPVGPGTGTYASRSLVIGGSAAFEAAGLAREALAATAAQALECAPEDVRFEEGEVFSAEGTGRRLGIGAVAALAQRGREATESGWFELEHVYVLPGSAFSFATHAAVVEVDRDTGRVRLVRYVAVHDPGPVVNPLIVRAQVQGGAVQGIGEALWEAVEYGPDGRTPHASLMDYAFPQASELPAIEVELLETPSTLTPTRMKGMGEAPAVAAFPAVGNAVHDALAQLPGGAEAVGEVHPPLTQERVWEAITRVRGA
jgi:carbon-monoxide dehydrogenase large subunit